MTESSPQALLFDVFGTVVDWRTGVATEARRFFDARGIDIDPFDFADQWRGEYQPTMERVRSGGRDYAPLDELHRENLDIVLERCGLAQHFSEEEKTGLNHAWERLPPWPDAVPGLTRLKQRFIVAPCSNGSIALMTRLAKFGALPWDVILGADIARTYKPRPEVYLACCAALQLDPSQVMMVAAHPDDLEAAAACGLSTAFIPRPQEHGATQNDMSQSGSQLAMHQAQDWDHTAASLEILAEILTA